MAVVKNTLSRRAADKTGRSALHPVPAGPHRARCGSTATRRGRRKRCRTSPRPTRTSSRFGAASSGRRTFRPRASCGSRACRRGTSCWRSSPARSRRRSSGLAGRLNSLIGNLARTLAAVRDSGALAPGEAPVPAAEAAPAEDEAPEAPAEAPPTATSRRRMPHLSLRWPRTRPRSPRRRMRRRTTPPNRVSKHQRTSPRATPPPMSSPQTTHPPRASPTTPKADQHVPRGVTTRWR